MLGLPVATDEAAVSVWGLGMLFEPLATSPSNDARTTNAALARVGILGRHGVHQNAAATIAPSNTVDDTSFAGMEKYRRGPWQTPGQTSSNRDTIQGLDTTAIMRGRPLKAKPVPSPIASRIAIARAIYS